MKKLIISALLALPVGLFAQGQINFANSTSPDSRFSTNSTATPPPGQAANAVGNLSGLNTYIIGLYSAPAGTVDESLFVLRITATNKTGAAAGLFNGGGPAKPPGFPAGTSVAFPLRALQGLAGSGSYEVATAPGQYRGKTAIGFVTAGDAISGPAGILFGNSAGQVLGAVLTPNPGVIVPEPSSIALGLLGLGAIALFRRRK